MSIPMCKAVRHLRKSYGVNQKEIAMDVLGYKSVSSYNSWETGYRKKEISVAQLIKILDLFQMSLGDFETYMTTLEKDHAIASEPDYTSLELDQLPDFFDQKTLAKLLNISYSTANRMIQRNGFPKTKIGGVVRINKSEFKEWIALQR